MQGVGEAFLRFVALDPQLERDLALAGCGLVEQQRRRERGDRHREEVQCRRGRVAQGVDERERCVLDARRRVGHEHDEQPLVARMHAVGDVREDHQCASDSE